MKKVKKWISMLDIFFIIASYLATFLSIIDNNAFNSFMFGQLGCIWYFIFVHRKFVAWLNDRKRFKENKNKTPTEHLRN